MWKRVWAFSHNANLTGHISAMALAGIVGIALGIVFGPLVACGLALGVVLLSALLSALRSASYSVALWSLSALLAPLLVWLLGLLHPAMALLPLGILLLASVASFFGVPLPSKVPLFERKVLEGTTPLSTSQHTEGLRGHIRAEHDAMPQAWVLRDSEGQVLVRGTNSGAWTLESSGEQIHLEGPLWVETKSTPHEIKADEATTRLGVPRELPLPEVLFLTERTVNPDEEVEVMGEITSEARAQGYRDVAFTRRLVGEPGKPLVLR